MEILRIKAVQRKTGLGRSTIYDRISKGAFPRQISLGGRAIGFLSTEIDEWIEEQVSRSRNCRTQHAVSTDAEHHNFRKMENLSRRENRPAHATKSDDPSPQGGEVKEGVLK
jgi:prophage regulatory protein